jgi:hypothetical protein
VPDNPELVRALARAVSILETASDLDVQFTVVGSKLEVDFPLALRDRHPVSWRSLQAAMVADAPLLARLVIEIERAGTTP